MTDAVLLPETEDEAAARQLATLELQRVAREERPRRVGLIMPAYRTIDVCGVRSLLGFLFAAREMPHLDVRPAVADGVGMSVNGEMALRGFLSSPDGWTPDVILWMESDIAVTPSDVLRLLDDHAAAEKDVGACLMGTVYRASGRPDVLVGCGVRGVFEGATSLEASPEQLALATRELHRCGVLEVHVAGFALCVWSIGIVHRSDAGRGAPFFREGVLAERAVYRHCDWVLCRWLREEDIPILANYRIDVGHVGRWPNYVPRPEAGGTDG